MSLFFELDIDDASANDGDALCRSFDAIRTFLQLWVDRRERRTFSGSSFAYGTVHVSGVHVVRNEVDLMSETGGRGAQDECADVAPDVEDHAAVPAGGKDGFGHGVAIAGVTL